MKTVIWRATLYTLPLLLGGCQTIGNWADSVGEHMPVIGQRCEHWQCFTASGQQISDANKTKEAQAQQAASQAAAAPAPPAAPAPNAPVITPALAPGLQTGTQGIEK